MGVSGCVGVGVGVCRCESMCGSVCVRVVGGGCKSVYCHIYLFTSTTNKGNICDGDIHVSYILAICSCCLVLISNG